MGTIAGIAYLRGHDLDSEYARRHFRVLTCACAGWAVDQSGRGVDERLHAVELNFDINVKDRGKDGRMKISELSRATDVSARSLRYYEQLGLINVARQANGYREYEESAVKTVTTIKSMIELGFPMALIEQVLPCTGPDGPVSDCSVVMQQVERIRDEIDAKARRLLETRDTLTDFLARGEGQTDF